MAKKIIPVQNKMFIFCEGDKTEPLYISSYIDDKVKTKTKVIKIPKTKKNTPVQLVEEAISVKKSNKSISGDEFWVVYDREAIAKYPNSKHDEAAKKARNNGINIALSNVCFEFWILLHFEKLSLTKPYSSYLDLMKNSKLKQYLNGVGIASYDKGSDDLYLRVKAGLDMARKRAPLINQQSLASCPLQNAAPHHLNPYSSVYKLLDAIDVF